MNADALRFLDRYLGVPLCLCFTFLRWVAGPFQSLKTLSTPRKVLVIKLSEMGSTVLAYPALAELKRRCPHVELFFLVFENNAPIIEALDLTTPSNIITVEMESMSRLLTSGFAAMARLLREQIDTTIDMDFFSRFTTLLSFLVCRGNRVGFHRYTNEGLYRGNLLTHRVMYSPHVHTAVAFMALIRTLFEKPDDEPHYRGRIGTEELVLPRHMPAPADLQSIRDKLRTAGVPDGNDHTLILINPNSSDIFPLRRWPIENFAQLCRQLLDAMPSCRLVITGVASEAKDARYIKERMQQNPRVVDFTGRTNFRELLALYSLASLMITNDSGPAHFASLLALPTVVLFGPETPRLYSPLGDRHRDLYADFACSPCVSVYNGKESPCGENRCLKAITVEKVLDEALSTLKTATPIGRTDLKSNG